MYEFKKESYQDKIGYVDSNIDLFPYSLKENILIFENENSQKEYKKIFKLVNMDTIIENLPNKYDTLVGDKGSKFSSGQKQRICIARALSKEPKILILDEATNYLDESNEKFVLENLSKFKGKKTIFFNTEMDILKYFDRVIFLLIGYYRRI